MGLALWSINHWISIRRGYRSAPRRMTWGERLLALWQAVPALLMPVIIIGGILGGLFTPTEASAVAVFYALFVGFFVTRS